MHWTHATPAARSRRPAAGLDTDRDAIDVAPEPALGEQPDPRRTVPTGDERHARAWIRAIDPAVAGERPDDDGSRSVPRLRRADRA